MRRRKLMLKILFGVIATVGSAVLIPGGVAEAQMTDAACYRTASRRTPNADLIDNLLREEVWCYRPLREPAGATLIYSGIGSEVSPLTSAIVESDGSLVHASMVAGEITVHRLKSRYNPLGIPLTPPSGVPRATDVEAAQTAGFSDGALEVLLRGPVIQEDLTVRAADSVVESARADAMPWRGFWWPYRSGRLHNGASSPLAKYDRFVRYYSGVNPGARLWEARNHRYDGTSWAGHCNGWAAAAIMRPEPRRAKRDPKSRITFTVADQKGILSEKDKCVELAFFGNRYDGKPGDQLYDIYPADFHETVVYYIGRLKKPVALDAMQGMGIQNNIASSYKMTVRQSAPDSFDVQTTLRIHKYDDGMSSAIGPAPAYLKTYSYRLYVDSDGQITASQWLSSNPDFLWAPLAPAQCHTSNPKVTEPWVQKIMGL